MFSSINVRPTRVPEEMNLSRRQRNSTTRHVECQSALDVMSLKSPVACNSYIKCNGDGAFSRTVSSGKDDDVLATLGSELENAARLSWNALPSSSAFSTTDRCSPSQEHDRPAYNCSTMKHHRSRSPRRECDARIFSHLFSSVYSIAGSCYHRVFRPQNLWRHDYRWGIDLPRIFFCFICILFFMMRITVYADHVDFIDDLDIDTRTPISKLPCGQGLSTPGVTRPYGDINIEYGTKPLRIMCILDPERVREKYPGKTSADLYFLREFDFVDKKYITIINETAILLEIRNPEPSKNLYTCGLRVDDNDEHNVAVCLNEVAIGHRPSKPENFHCVSNNWENLRCSWKPVQNFVKTTYNLTFTLPGKRSRKLFPCPKDINETSKADARQIIAPTDKNSCYWDTKTNPIYRQPYETYTFILFAYNPFENTSFMYKVDHFSNVIPHSPTALHVTNITLNGARLIWSLPFPLQNLPVGVHHRIMYQNQLHSNSKNATWTVINITDKIREEHKDYNFTDLNCGFCEFDVRILLKSASAPDVEHMWSKPGIIKFRTASSTPSYPPRTDIGSFEITEIDDKSRDVFLYWQRIPQNHENGENFMYEVDHVEKNGINSPYFKNKNSTVAFIKYTITTDSKYLFRVASKNEVGPSNGRSELIVPTQSEISSLEPNAFTKIAYNETLYELSWKPPIVKNIKNYTIYWCEDTRDRPYQCTGYLDWVHVPKNTTMYNVTVSNPSKVYQFAISTNTEQISSGMVWASCTVIHNKVTSKMKDVWINSIGSRSIEVGWKLDCSDRVGIIDGFNIYYCPIVSPYKLQCQENTKKNITIVAGPHTIHGTARELQPYTTYMLYVTVLTKFGEGTSSDVLYNTTLEDAPSTPPQDLQVVNVTNTTISLQWKQPKEMNGVLRYYEVQYNNGQKQLRVEELSIELTNLDPYTRYNISVRACTISCSNLTSVVQLTEIGVPGKINKPYSYFTNGSETILKWNPPKNSGGPVHYYEILLHDNNHIQHTNASEIELSIPNCKDVDDPQKPFYFFRVRAVNIVNETQLRGPWSSAVGLDCHSDGPSFAAWLIICITSIIGIGVLFGCLVYSSRRIWSKCRAMQDVEVKLPPGLAPNIKLLPNVGEQHMRQPSADSSGCSSAQDSVTSSLTTNSQVSNDSGTDMASDPASPDKLLESLPSWESKRARQKNVGNARSTENAHWESYVKVAKSGEPMLGETLSLTRSTPNLTESAGCTTSQHTWSSTGYISMPSSEEASSNPSPVPRENAFAAPIPGIANYSVVGSMPKPVQAKPEDSVIGRPTATVGDALITLQAEMAKSSKPYIALSALDKKLKKPKHATDSLDLDELTFIEPDKCNNADAQAPSQLDHDADKISKPYVQTGLIDTLEKQYLLNPIVETKRNLLCGSFMSPASHSKPFVPTSFWPTSESLTELPSSSAKPYVAVSSISEEMAAPSLTRAANEPSPRRPYVQHAIPAASSETSSKPYTLASSIRSLQLQRGKAELCARGTSDEKKKVNADDKSPSVKVEPNRSVFAKQTGYVTLAENPLGKLKPTPTPSQKQLEKSSQQTPATTNHLADGQYSKVTVVPSTM